MQLVVMSAIMIASLPLLTAGGRTLAVEHMYYDSSQPSSYEALQLAIRNGKTDTGLKFLASDHSALVPIVAKLKCKGAGCPQIDSRMGTLMDCAWISVCNRTLYVEETSGWVMFWLDEHRTLPLTPTPFEQKNEYLQGGRAGTLVLF